MASIRIMFSRFSAFYTPLICTAAGGFLKQEGLDPAIGVATPAKPARAAIEDGSFHVTQSAVSSSWPLIEAGRPSPVAHFAQINRMDGFFLVGREPDPDFTWDKLVGKRVLADHGAQPFAMLRYAAHRMGVDFARIDAVDVGGGDAIDAGFRARRADFAHLQGPAPQQMERDGVGHVLASVGEAIGPVAFSSLAARRDWIGSGMAAAFMRAYRKARALVIESPPAEIARLQRSYFSAVNEDALAKSIAYYQGLGAWNPAVEIDREAYAAALDVFEHAGLIATRPDYDDVVVAPPDG